MLCDEFPGVSSGPSEDGSYLVWSLANGLVGNLGFKKRGAEQPTAQPFPGDHLTDVEGFGKKFVTSPHTISKLCAGWSGEVLPSHNMFVDDGGDQVEHKPVQRRDA